jgi:hypothetical protein
MAWRKLWLSYMGLLKQSRIVLRKPQSCDDGSKGEEKEEALDAS